MENRLELLDLPESVRDLVVACEVTGRRTLFERQGRSVAVLISFDEYMAMRETIAIVNDPVLRERIAAADDEARRNALLLAEDLLVE